ncbi:MAG TPA: replicative DNA helicase [Thermoleophilaceae bacterium]|nr:replicative DNA helicase [Thermoleophilaceae bacterium]
MATATSSSAPGGVPPHNEEAEASVLGAILMTEQALDGVLLEVGLRPDHFYRPRHQLVFHAMIRLKEKAEPEAVDALTVCDDLRSHGELESAGGEGYVHGLPAVVPAVGAVLDYARIVRDDALMRGILETTRQIQAEVLAHRGEPQELIERAETALFHIGHDTGKGEMRSLEDVLHDEMDKLVELSRKDVGLTGVTSGFADLDDVTGGFQAGNLIVLAARPSMGKSALAANIAENAAVEAGVPVAFFSLEMSETELAHRFLASRARVSSDELRKGKVRSDRWPKVNAAASKLAEAPLYIDDSSDLGVLELRAKARRLQNRHGLGLIIVDYLQLMRPDGRADSRVEQIGQMSRGLKILARELDVPVIAISQLSRAVESRNPPEPMLSDLRESGCLTGDSRVYLPETGEYRPIRELVGQSGFDVVAVNPATLKLERRRGTKAFSTGSKPVLRLTTALGRTIRATGNHRFLAFDGWKHLDELAEGEHIALPRTLPGPAEATMTDDELALLGHLIGDGCTLPRHVIQYTTREAAIARTVGDLADRVFGDAIRPRINRERTWYQVYLPATRRLARGRRNPIASWLDDLGCFGLRSYEKRVPAAVFRQPVKAIALFLRHLWATDGCVFLSRGKRGGAPIVYYATSSPGLATDVRSLLLRLGINAIRSPVRASKGRPHFHVKLTGAPDVTRFLQMVGCLGESRTATGRLILEALGASSSNPNRDVIPAAAWREHVVPAMAAPAISTRQLQAGLGNAYCGSSLYRSNLSRERAARAARIVQSDNLARLATSDVYWDRVVSVIPDGHEEVFDLTVDGLHNFVAEDMVVHNSIEQDADVVMFVYRDEYYNKETERLGEADLLVRKHRNGPIGDVTLSFLPKYPKFASLYRDREGIAPPQSDNGGG